MRPKIDCCWQRAPECDTRAKEAADVEVREFFIRLQDSWISAFNRYEILEAAAVHPPVNDQLPNFQAPSPGVPPCASSCTKANRAPLGI
jgi:hypothetical protein